MTRETSMKIGEFTRESSAVLARAVADEAPQHIRNRDAEYATIVSTGRYHQMTAAEDIVQGLLRLAGRAADCSEYQAYAEALEDMASCGHLNIAQPCDQEPAAAT